VLGPVADDVMPQVLGRLQLDWWLVPAATATASWTTTAWSYLLSMFDDNSGSPCYDIKKIVSRHEKPSTMGFRSALKPRTKAPIKASRQ
jgi:hypothetical protein